MKTRTFILVTFFVSWHKSDTSKIPKAYRPKAGIRYVRHAFQCSQELDLTEIPEVIRILREKQIREGKSVIDLHSIRIIRAKNPPKDCLKVFWSGSHWPMRLVDKAREIARRGVELDFK